MMTFNKTMDAYFKEKGHMAISINAQAGQGMKEIAQPCVLEKKI